MVGFGRYSKHDLSHQEFYCTQINLARQRISNFPFIDTIFENFNNAENLNYKQNKNRIFLTCIQHISSIDPNIFSENNRNSSDVVPIKISVNSSEYPYLLDLLEKSFSYLDILKWNDKQYNLFKDRITDYDYFTSNSAFSEITTVFRMGMKIGFNNIKYEPKISNGKNSDILVYLNGKDIYIELTAINESTPEKKIQSIMDNVAEYLFYKIKTDNIFHMEIWLDTTKLVHTDDHIDEEKSKKLLFDWINKLHIHDLANSYGSLQLSEYRYHSGIMEYSQQSLIDYPYHRKLMQELFEKQPIIKNWASKVSILDIIQSPFVSISCRNEFTISSVTIHEDVMHSTHQELVNSHQFSDIETGKLQEDSFLRQISRKIYYKINEEQYNRGTPIIFMINAKLWSNSYETMDDDFLKIENIVKKVLGSYPHISGVLLYYTDYTNGRFIQNPNVDPKVRITNSELSLLFS